MNFFIKYLILAFFLANAGFWLVADHKWRCTWTDKVRTPCANVNTHRMIGAGFLVLSLGLFFLTSTRSNA